MNLTRTMSPHDAPGLLYCGFNQDFGCFAIGLDKGFRVYNCDPLIEQARNETGEGGIALIEMLYRTNYLALVGGGRNPRYPPNKVVIWDSIKGKPVVELEYKSQVKNCKLRRERLIVVLANKVFVYQFSLHPQLLHMMETADNEKGLAAVSSSQYHAILVVPGQQRGHLQIIDLQQEGPPQTASLIAAHSGKLSCLALNHDGSKCATASDKGTLIRVFNTATATLLNELRRGMDRAEIFSIAFNHDSTRLCVSSDKGTIHVFNLDPSVVTMSDHKPRGPTYGQVVVHPSQSPSQFGLTHSGNRGSSLSFMKELLPKYFSSEWSFAHARIVTESRCIVAFGEEKNTILGYWWKELED
ncbi:WD40-repeat-containing domain protein [Spinellus fusiger]|nr:WD40-repeat-containing domain protein [Spinellus fusiger]